MPQPRTLVAVEAVPGKLDSSQPAAWNSAPGRGLGPGLDLVLAARVDGEAVADVVAVGRVELGCTDDMVAVNLVASVDFDGHYP